MCDDATAVRRLFSRWLAAKIENPDTAIDLPLGRIIVSGNINVTALLNLYAEYNSIGERRDGYQSIARAYDERYRRGILLRAWLEPRRRGAVQ